MEGGQGAMRGGAWRQHALSCQPSARGLGTLISTKDGSALIYTATALGRFFLPTIAKNADTSLHSPYTCSYFFYKNAVYTLTQFWFNMATGYSAQRLYDDWHQSLFNLVFTCAPVVAAGLLDRDSPARAARARADLYAATVRGDALSARALAAWAASALWHSAVCYGLPALALGAGAGGGPAGGPLSLWETGTLSFTLVVVVVNLRLLLASPTHTWVHVGVVFGSVGLYVGYAAAYSAIPPVLLAGLAPAATMYGVAHTARENGWDGGAWRFGGRALPGTAHWPVLPVASTTPRSRPYWPCAPAHPPGDGRRARPSGWGTRDLLGAEAAWGGCAGRRLPRGRGHSPGMITPSPNPSPISNRILWGRGQMGEAADPNRLHLPPPPLPPHFSAGGPACGMDHAGRGRGRLPAA